MQRAKLWKRILHEGVELGQRMRSRSDEREVVAELLGLPIIVDTRSHAADVVFKTSEIRDVVFPFERFFIECQGIELTNKDDPGDKFDALVGGIVEAKRLPENRWLAETVVVIATKKRPRVIALVDCNIDANGMIEGEPDVYTDVPESMKLAVGGVSATITVMILDTLALLGCKNVSLDAKPNDPKQVRIATKRHGVNASGYRYHTLVVRPPGLKLGTPGQEVGSTPRHKCRGHYRHYGPKYGKGLLLGKFEGKFYIPPHFKGDAKNGTVEKDYLIPERKEG